MLSFTRVAATVLCVGILSVTAQAQTLTGNWNVVEGTLHGVPVPASILKAMALNLSQTSFSATSQSLNSSGTYTVNNAANPAQIVFTIDAGADNGRELKGIYQLQNGSLQITFSESAEFPTEFSSSAGNKYLALTYSQTQVAGAASGPGQTAGPGQFRGPGAPIGPPGSPPTINSGGAGAGRID